jgi:hypothetical protein
MKFHMIKLSVNEDCLVCGARPTAMLDPIEDRFFEETCARDGRRNFIISPKERTEINLEQLRIILGEKGFHIRSSGIFGITFEQSDDIITSILKSGVMVIQTSPKLKNNVKDEIFETYKSILIDGLGLSHTILPAV